MAAAVFVLGLGFLGQPLAHALRQQGWSVAGSRRRAPSEAEEGFYSFDVTADVPNAAAQPALLMAESLVCLLPPSSSANYAADVMRLIGWMQANGRLRQVVLASSTSVYGDEARVCTEATPTAASTASAQAIVALETAVNQSTVAQVSVLRFGGLFGPSRHPVTALATKQQIKGAQQPVNVVSQSDAVAAIMQVLAKPLSARQLYNVCHPQHPSKQAFYQREADRRGLGVLAFEAGACSEGKIIDGGAYLKDYGVVMDDLI